jgi:3',5'-cyclic AMP phosphodiesterase CpdA
MLGSVSDIHYMVPSLLAADGPAFQAYLAQDPKKLAQSQAILDSALNAISNAHPDIVRVSGDMTKDAELVSHRLWNLKTAGTPRATRVRGAEQGQGFSPTSGWEKSRQTAHGVPEMMMRCVMHPISCRTQANDARRALA